MNSISTNPFDDDENADSITIASNLEYAPNQMLHKKKRRAPQPPTPSPTPVSILHKYLHAFYIRLLNY